MTDTELLQRIRVDPKLMAGKPVIAGTRLTVEYVLGLLAHGASVREILDEYDGLTEDDVRACLLFGSRTVGDATWLPFDPKAA